MSSIVPIHASAELKDAFSNASSSKTRFIRVVIENVQNPDDTMRSIEQFAIGSTVSTSGNLEADFGKLPEILDEEKPCYLLVKLDSTGPVRIPAAKEAWLLIMWTPGNNPRHKMVYAAAVEALKGELGAGKFDEVRHASSFDEASWNAYVDSHSKNGPLPWSNAEISRQKAYDAEADGRKEQMEDLQRAAQGAGAGGSSSKSSGGSGKIGGYHSVVIPLAESAVSMLNAFKSGSSTFVHLKISKDGREVVGIDVNGADGAAIISPSISQIPSLIDGELPGFYFVKYEKKVIFVYCCPDNSPIRSRMPYSTAKPGVIDEAKKAGVMVEEEKTRMQVEVGA